MIAVACIFGGAATAGAVTLAVMDDGHEAHTTCAIEARALAPNVVVSSEDGARVIVGVPNVRVHADHDCGIVIHEDVHLRMEQARREVERARERVQEARERSERVRIRIRRHQMEEAEALEQVAAQLESQALETQPLQLALERMNLALATELEPEVEVRLEAKLKDLQEKIERDLQEKLEKSGGGTNR
jgi:hypothetical protein